MQDNSNLIKVIDVVDYHFMLQLDKDNFDPYVTILHSDIELSGLSFFEFGAELGNLQQLGFLNVLNTYNPIASTLPEKELNESMYNTGSTPAFGVEMIKDYSEYKQTLQKNKPTILPVKKLSFDPESSILHINSTEILISKTKRTTNAHDLLIAMHDNFFETYDYSVLERKCNLDSKALWKSCLDIKQRVGKETGISDFLDFSMQKNGYVKIRSKYLPK